MLTMREGYLLPPYLQSGEGRTAEANARTFLQPASGGYRLAALLTLRWMGNKQVGAVRNKVSATPFAHGFPDSGLSLP